MKEQPTSAIDNLNRRIAKHLKVSFIVSGVSLLLAATLNLLTWQQGNQYQAATQELTSQQQSLDNAASYRQYLEDNQQEVAVIDQVLPDRDHFLMFLNDIETIVRQYDNAPEINPLGNPSAQNGELSIPMTIKTSVTYRQALELMRQFEQMPYVFQVISTDMRFPQGITQPAQIEIAGRVYVQDPFNQ